VNQTSGYKPKTSIRLSRTISQPEPESSSGKKIVVLFLLLVNTGSCSLRIDSQGKKEKS